MTAWRPLLYVAVVALLVSAAVWLANDPGSASLDWRGWRIDTSVGVLIVAMIAAVLLITFLIRGAALVGGVVRAVAAAQRERRLKRGLTSLADGFAAVQAGQSKAALRFAKEAAAVLADNPAVILLRSEAAALQANSDEVKETAGALLARPQTELAGLRMLAARAQAEGDTAGALAHARRALARSDAPDWALHTALDILIATAKWREATGLLDMKLARDTFAPATLRRLRALLLIQQANADLRNGESAAAAAAAKEAIDTNGAVVPATVAYARAMAAQGKGRKAASLVEKAWAEAPHPELANAYRVLVPGESALEWARRIDTLARLAPDHPESRLAVARASLDAQLWGQARNRLTTLTAPTVEPGVRARAARLLADVEDRERGDAEKAAQWFKLALELREPAQERPAPPKTAAELLARV